MSNLRKGSKVRLSRDAPLTLKCVHGEAAVLTVLQARRGMITVRQDWTRSEFTTSHHNLERLDRTDATAQAAIYAAHMDKISTPRRRFERMMGESQ